MKLILICSCFFFHRDKDLEQRQPGEDGSQASTSSPQNSKEPSAGDTEADEADGASVAPKVKLDADGNIILDEERYYAHQLTVEQRTCFTVCTI